METTSTLTRQDIPTTPQASSGWVSPSGDFFYVRDCNHCYVAEEFLNDPTGGDRLIALGWAHVGSGYITLHAVATQAQMDTLWDVVVAYTEANHRFARDLYEVYQELVVN